MRGLGRREGAGPQASNPAAAALLETAGGSCQIELFLGGVQRHTLGGYFLVRSVSVCIFFRAKKTK